MFNRFPGGRQKALTLSYDDGVFQDQRLIEIFRRHQLKATFFINSGLAGKNNRLPMADIPAIYAGFEVGIHTVHHPSLAAIPPSVMCKEIADDRTAFEQILSRPVRGMSYPNGSFSDAVVAALAACQIAYARTTIASGNFAFPADPLRWHPTCHHRVAEEALSPFFDEIHPHHYRLLYIWGHSYEFDQNIPANSWEYIENLCTRLAGHEDTWYATNGEVIGYQTALQRLETSFDGRIIHNPSTLDVWVSCHEKNIHVPGGATVLVK